MKKFLLIVFCVFFAMFFVACEGNTKNDAETIKLQDTTSEINKYRDEAMLSLIDLKKDNYVYSINVATNEALQYLPYCKTDENFQLVIDWHKNIILLLCSDQIYLYLQEEYNNCTQDLQSVENKIAYEESFIEEYTTSYEDELREYKIEVRKLWGTVLPYLIDQFNSNYNATLSYHRNELENAKQRYNDLLISIANYEQGLGEAEILLNNLNENYIVLSQEISTFVPNNEL